MNTTEYGTVEYFEAGFSDFLGEISADDPKTTENLIEGFYRALDSWFDYHDAQARAYAEVRKRVREALAV